MYKRLCHNGARYNGTRLYMAPIYLRPIHSSRHYHKGMTCSNTFLKHWNVNVRNIKSAPLLVSPWKNGYLEFLHDRYWISPWIKSIYNKYDKIFHVFVPQLSGHCDVISNRFWRHPHNVNWTSETYGRVSRSSFLSSFMYSFCSIRYKIMYVLSWRNIYALTRVVFWCLFHSLLCNSGNKHLK